MARILVLGGGFGGIAAAVELRRRLPARHEVAVLDARSHFRMGLRKLWDLDGRSAPEEGARPLADLGRLGIEVLRGPVDAIDTAGHSVTAAGVRMPYDRLVLALGAELAPEAVPGFGHAHNLYAPDGVLAARDALEQFGAGAILVLVCAMPFRCPPAPYEAALLVDALLRRRGVRPRTSVTLATPEPHPLPVAPRENGERLLPLLARAGVAYRPQHKVARLRDGVAEFDGGATIPFDLALAVPPHRAPAVVRASGLTDASGWIPVDPATCATPHPDVWAIGDVAAAKLANGKMLPKAGILAEGQARTVASAIAASLGHGAIEPFEARGECFIELGDGTAMAAAGDFFHKPEPQFTFEPPSKAGLARKVAFEQDRLKAWFG